MKKLLVIGLLLAICAIASPAVASTLYVDDDGICGGNLPCFLHPQDAVNAALVGDTILVYPGTYGSWYSACGWGSTLGACGCGDWFAPALIVYKDDLTIRATGSAAETIIESTHLCWSNPPAVQRSTNYAVNSIAAPNGVSIIADGVTIDGFTLRSLFAGDPGTNYPNTAGIMIGGLYAGDQNHLGVTGTTVKNCVISGHSGIYNWRASDTMIEGNTVRVLDSDALSNTVNGNGVVVWDGWFEGFFPPTSTGVQVLNNDIGTCNVDTSSGDEGKGIMFGGTEQTTCQWCPTTPPSAAIGADQSGMLIDGNTICAASTGIKFWNSLGTDKLITCDNTITWHSYKIHDYGVDDGYPPSTYTVEPCPPYQPCASNVITNWNFEDGNQGFSTDYVFVDPSNTGTWTLGPEKTYTVSTDPHLYHSAWTGFGDHTTGSGKMMIINARRSDQGPDEVIWEQTVPVAPNTAYTFSYWIALSHPDNPPRLETYINGVLVGTKDMSGPTGQWVQVTYDWFSDDTTEATIQFVDATVEAWGDDFVLDDIELCGTPCLGYGGGLTLGFWSNKNGQKLFGADDLLLMVSLNLRNADGSNFDPASYAAFKTWLLAANANNMANMLSAQLAAMELNVLNGKVDGDAWIYAGPTLGYMTIDDLMDAANAALASDGLTLAGDPNRMTQEALKNALDKANNNYNFVIPCNGAAD